MASPEFPPQALGYVYGPRDVALAASDPHGILAVRQLQCPAFAKPGNQPRAHAGQQNSTRSRNSVHGHGTAKAVLTCQVGVKHGLEAGRRPSEGQLEIELRRRHGGNGAESRRTDRVVHRDARDVDLEISVANRCCAHGDQVAIAQRTRQVRNRISAVRDRDGRTGRRQGVRPTRNPAYGKVGDVRRMRRPVCRCHCLIPS